MPNGALASLAGNAGKHHEVAIADLILVQDAVQATVERLMRQLDPEVVGLSVMTFQRRTALQVVRLVRAIKPGITVVAGGYDPSLAAEAYESPDAGIDFLVRGEGDVTFRSLLSALERADEAAIDAIPGLSVHDGHRFRHNPPRAVSGLDDGTIALPARGARVLGGYTFMGRAIDVLETSRGCTFDCSFCSIIEMRGRNFHVYDFERVLADIKDARDHGARVIFLVDDNVTLNVPRFEALCRAIVDASLHHLDYVVQAMTSAIADHGDTLAPLMRKAGFRYVFLGIENVLDDDLAFLNAREKNAMRDGGRRRASATLTAVEHLHRNGMFVVGGLIVGNPDDTRASIDANLDFAKQHVDWPYIQHPTPYPGTPMTKDFRDRGLIVNTHVDEYDGTSAVTRSAHLEADEIEYLRWRADRWMKVRHMPAAIRLYPGFVFTHARRMMAHTFRGTTWRSVLGLESSRESFRRYKQIRARERTYLDWPDPAPSDPDVRHTLGISQKPVYDLIQVTSGTPIDSLR
jgi:radical SAM superfamily enzyme YgiQ (UPF0313 family)